MGIIENKQSGFTIVELIIAIVVIGILATLSIGIIPNSLAQGRDKERISDIDTIANKLEEYYTNNNGYPSSLTSLRRVDPETLMDPQGHSITINSPSNNFFSAMATPTPTKSTASEYSYSTYPAGCSTSSPCMGYVLKTYIEIPDAKNSNPYVKTGVNNN